MLPILSVEAIPLFAVEILYLKKNVLTTNVRQEMLSNTSQYVISCHQFKQSE